MNVRERFNAIMDYEAFDRQPLWYFGQWHETRDRWWEEGVPKGSPFWSYFSMDHDWEQYMWSGLGLKTEINPFEHKILEENDEFVLERCVDGVIRKSNKIGECIPEGVDVFLKDRASWSEFKKRYEDRIPTRRIGRSEKPSFIRTVISCSPSWGARSTAGRAVG